MLDGSDACSDERSNLEVDDDKAKKGKRARAWMREEARGVREGGRRRDCRPLFVHCHAYLIAILLDVSGHAVE